jgi:Tfp pilus assembly protein PilN
MMASTNLAQRPFRNERLPWLLAGLLMAVALVISVVHGRYIARLLSGNEATTVLHVRENEARIALLERDIAAEPPLRIETPELVRLRAYKELVDHRVFPWRLLLSELEAVLGEGVRLTRIAPAGPRGGQGMLIKVSGEARSKDEAFTLAEDLDRSAAFSSAVLTSLAERDNETAFDIEVIFDPANQPKVGTP